VRECFFSSVSPNPMQIHTFKCGYKSERFGDIKTIIPKMINKKATVFQYLDFEKRIEKIESDIEELNKLSSKEKIDYSAEIRKLEKSKTKELTKIYSNLTAWQTVNVARHPNRPVFQDYLENIITDFAELHGDKCFGDDRSIITGFGSIGLDKLMIIGQNKGKTTKERIEANFGCTNPEGYRKALHKMKLAEKFGIPVITFIDTKGADPGIGAEERGQAHTIAVNLREMSRLKVPIISIVIGEGGSGGALGIGACDKLAMLEHSYYSVISPEGCAGILFKNGKKAPLAAEALKLASRDLYKLKLIDHIIKEPLGGAHRNYHDTFSSIKFYVIETLESLKKIKLEDLLEKRYVKLRNVDKNFIKSRT